MKKCSICESKKEKSAFFKTSSICKECKNCRAKEERQKLKLKWVLEKGGKCERCGYNKNLSALDFHHIENRDIPHGQSLTNYLNQFEEEINKCILLCKNCCAIRLWAKNG